MKITWLKGKKDTESFKMFENLGFDVCKIDDLEDTDKKLKELVNQDYTTIIMTSEVAGFSENIIKKYKKSEAVKIIIAPLNKDE